MKIVPNYSGPFCQRKTTEFYQETENSEWQMKDKHGYVSGVCRKRNSKSNCHARSTRVFTVILGNDKKS